MEELRELGLTQNEVKIYEALVKFGKLGASEVSARSGVSYSRVYDVLESLVEKGLVGIVPEATKKFIPGDPAVLIEMVEKKKADLDKVKVKAGELKQFYEMKEKNPIQVGVGKKAFYKIVKQLGPAKTFSYSVKWTSEYREDWAREQRANKKKGLNIAVLTRYDKETEKDVKKWARINKDIRKFDNDGVAMGIRDDEIMISMIKSNVTLLIRDKAFIKIMKKFFEDSYGNAEMIK